VEANVQYSEEIYDSARRPHPLIDELLALIKYRELVYQFTARSITARYKRSIIGVAWTMLNPLMTMIVLTLVFSQIFKWNVPFYPVYVLSGLIVWGFFSHTTSSAMGEMIWSGGLLNRIYVPKSVFAVSAIGTGLVNLGLSLVPLLLIAFILGTKMSFALLVLPFAVFLLALFALGVGLILATAAVYFADMIPVYEVVLTIWFYATPIIYPIEIVPTNLLWLFRLNPMLYLLQIFRDPLYNGVVSSWEVWAIAAGSAVIAFLAGGLIFTSKSNEYAYRI
jgi:ABC-type polysaccharide/polyol phosphate export permease